MQVDTLPVLPERKYLADEFKQLLAWIQRGQCSVQMHRTRELLTRMREFVAKLILEANQKTRMHLESTSRSFTPMAGR